jgi:hypothetical protein
MKRRLLLCLLFASGVTGAASASSLPPGTLLSVDQTAGSMQLGTLFTVNQATGQRTVFSDFNNAAQGVLGVDPNAVAWLPPQLLGLIPGAALVTDGSGGTNEQGALYMVDPSSGQRSLLSDFGNSNQGPLGSYPEGLLVVPASLLGWWSGVLVCDPFAGTNGQGALFSVDGAGNRTTIIDFGDDSGTQGVYPDSMALYSGLLGLGNAVLVTDGSAGSTGQGVLFTVNPATRTRSVLSDFGNASQGWVDPNLLSTPISVLVTPNDQIYVLVDEAGTNGAGALVQVNASTGYRTLVSDFGNAAQGVLGVDPNALAWLPSSGGIAVSDGDDGTGNDGEVFLVNPSNGMRTTLSDFGNSNEGVMGAEPSGLAVTQ